MTTKSKVEFYQVGSDGMVRNHSIDYSRGIGSLFVCANDYADLMAENERLRKAGDAMRDCVDSDIFPNIIADWNAAKEGGDAK